MAFVYAEMPELNYFQESIETTLSPLRRESTSQNDLIDRTKSRMEEALSSARTSERKAESSYYDAQQTLRTAEARTAEYNRNLQDDQEPMTTASFYYERVSDCAYNMQMATSRRQQIEEAISDFEDYSRKYKDSQENLISNYRKLLNESGNFFFEYVSILQKAKDVITQEINATSEGDSSTFSGDCSNLSEKDIAIISSATGWDEKTIRQKCGKEASIYTYKTNNISYENKLHSSGVFFERCQFEINGVCFEGVFPNFDTIFEPPLMPKSLWTDTDGKYTTQFKYCNEQLKKAVAKDPVLASNFNATQLRQIQDGKTPAGYTWHHHQEPGKMQLVRKQQHNSALGGANHTGGGALWCKYN